MADKIKVAHIIRVFSYGGAEISLKELLSTKVFKENCISDLYILDHKKLELIPEVKSNVREIYTYKITTLFFVLEYIRFLKQVVSHKYHIVHMHLPVAGWMSAIAKLFSRKTKFIYTEHTLVSFYKKYNYYLSALTYAFHDSVIAVSEEVSDEIQRHQKGWFFKRANAVTILNGIDTEKFFVPERREITCPSNLVVGLVARLRQHKRLDRWLEVAEEIHSRNKNIKFIIVGDGPDENFLQTKIVEKKLTGIIQLPGKTNDTVNAYKRIDIFLLTSDLEGLPLALMEAMSCGCVPVAYNVGGIKQLDFGNAGFKFNNFDRVTVAEKILYYSQHPEKYFSESIEARKFAVESCSLFAQANKILDLYKQLLCH